MKGCKLIGIAVSLTGILMLTACPPYRQIALFANNQDSWALFNSRSIIGMNGERQIGSLPPQAILRIYNNLGTPDAHLEVCNNPDSTTCVCDPSTGAGYVRVDANPTLTASIIRDQHIIYRPAGSEFIIRRQPVQWESGTEATQFPVYNFALYANGTAGDNSIHSFRFRAFPVGCPESVPSLRIVNAEGAEVYRIEPTGRVIYVRQGNSGVAGDNPAVGTGPFAPTIPPTINGVPMDFVPPGSTVVTGTGPVEVTVSRELATLSAEFWQDISPRDGLFESGPVMTVVDAVRKNPDGTFTYTLLTPALQKDPTPGVAVSTMFVIKLNIGESSGGFNLLQPALYQAQTQDMHGNLLCDFRDLIGDVGFICENCSAHYGTVYPGGPADIGGCWLSPLTGVSGQYVRVLPYFFQYDPPPTGNPPPPPPPGTSPTIVELEIKPDAFHCNTGVFTAFITFEDDERFNGAGVDVATCNCNGAEAFKIINDPENHHYAICKFNRNEITYNLGTDFVCTGTTTTGIEWRGIDEIEKIIDDCNG